MLIASYWIVGKGKRENFSPRPGFSAVGVISFAIGAVFACITGGPFASFPGLVEALPFLNWPFFVGPVNGIVVSLVLYVGLAKLTSAKRMPCVISAAGGAGICPLLLHTAIITKEGKGHAKNRNP